MGWVIVPPWVDQPMIIVNFVCDTCTSFATRLRFDLYTFLEIFGWVWLGSLCVQQFWACKFTVSLCLLLLVRWRVVVVVVVYLYSASRERWSEEKRSEVRWRETSQMIFWSHLVSKFDRMIFFGHLVAECEYIEFDYLETETELMYVREWPQYCRVKR